MDRPNSPHKPDLPREGFADPDKLSDLRTEAQQRMEAEERAYGIPSPTALPFRDSFTETVYGGPPLPPDNTAPVHGAPPFQPPPAPVYGGPPLPPTRSRSALIIGAIAVLVAILILAFWFSARS